MEHNINIILTRHGRYDKTENEKLSGHLTEQGKIEIRQKTKKRIYRIGNILNTEFLILGSPTYWLSNKYNGQRALETSIITKQTIKSILISQGVNVEDINKYFYTKRELYIRDTKNKVPIQDLANLLAEPNVYDEAPGYIRKLKLKHNGMNEAFWHELSASEEAKQFSKKAETPSVINQKIKIMLNYIINWAKDYSSSNDKDVCVFLITHGEIIEPFLNNHKLRLICGTAYNEGIILKIRANQIIVETEDEQFIGPQPLLNLEKEKEI